MCTPLAARLESDEQRPSVTAFPDGSVDYFYDVFGGDGRVRRREEFTEAVASGRTAAFTLQRTAVEPGGHAVNMAAQAHLLGDDVALVSHLDDQVFEDLPFETRSMGDPARVAIHGFEDGDVLTVEPSSDIEEWSLAAFQAVTGERFHPLLSADVVFCTNWTTFDAIPEAFAELAAMDIDGGHFVFDPGDVAARSEAEIRGLFDALTDLTESYDVVLAANGEETRSLAATVDNDSPNSVDLETSLDALRETADVSAAVVHEADVAVASTSEGRIRVENFDVEPVRNTGGGDRFDAGLAHALARGWSWEDALRLGNACASYYVASGDSGTAAGLAAFLRDRE